MKDYSDSCIDIGMIHKKLYQSLLDKRWGQARNNALDIVSSAYKIVHFCEDMLCQTTISSEIDSTCSALASQPLPNVSKVSNDL